MHHRMNEETGVESQSLISLCESQLEAARTSTNGRSAVTVYGGREHALRQTLIAMVGGQRLGDHEAPGQATLQVLEGEVRVHAESESWDGSEGDYLVLPLQRHDLEAVSDA